MGDGVPINFIDDPQAPEIFVSGISGVFLTGANVAIALESVRVDHTTQPGPINRVVVGRIVLTVEAAQRLVVGLNAFLEEKGLSPSRAVKGGETAQ
jgi:hypothetical protein